MTRLRRLAAQIRRALSNVPGLAGVALVAYGVWLAWPPGGFIAAGLVLILLDTEAS